MIIIKDNACSNLAFIADKDDCDITRSHQYLRAIIIESGLKILSHDDNDMIQWHIDVNMLSIGMSTADREMEEALSLSLKELLAEHRGTRMAIGDVRRQLLGITQKDVEGDGLIQRNHERAQTIFVQQGSS